MATFDLLPDDILHIIIQFAPHNALLAIAHVSKSLNRCATPYLYRYVYLWEKTHRASDRPVSIDWPNNLTQMCRAADESTRIWNLEFCRQTMAQRPNLRGYVVGASFECKFSDHDKRLVPAVVEILAGSAKFLHAAPEMPVPPSDYFKYLTSLEIDGDYLGSDYERRTSNSNILYDIFCLPMLVSLSVARVRCWSCFDPSTIRPERAGTSKVKNLLFRDSVIPGSDLDEILTWPEVLKSYRFELTPDTCGRFGGHAAVPRASNLSTALRLQASSLEVLHIYGDSERNDSDYAFHVYDHLNIVNLRDFTKLRRVGLRLSYMMVYISDAELYNVEIGDFPRAYQILPPALEELQIEIQEDFPAAVFFASDPSLEVELRAGELSATMISIFRNKETYFPHLRKVSFFQCRNFAGADDLRTILEYSGSAGVDVSWSSCRNPPLFNS
ncbi:hypothetical protein DL98DRAFT_589044 [Cadophora sp. DSE1049]|nr:hypothetical protein DL98DRAFT_589044 [Cadophora sp. DSE1049]